MIFVLHCALVLAVWRIKHVDAQDRFACLSCSYTRSASIEVGYGCIINPNPAQTISCTSPFVCKTIAVMDPGRTYIKSATRNCLPQTTACNGEYCCSNDGVYSAQCEQVCSENYCNDIDAETFLKVIEGNTLLPGRSTPVTNQDSDDDDDKDANDDNDGSDGDAGSDQPGSDSDGGGVLNPDDLIFVHQDLFHVDVNSGSGFYVSVVVVSFTVCANKLIVMLLS